MKPARPRARAAAEQPHCVERGERVDRWEVVTVGNRHRRNPPHDLAGDVEDLSARREHRQLRATPRQLVDESRAFVEHVFAVVEHQQHRLVTDVIAERGDEGHVGVFVCAEHVGDLTVDARARGQRRELHVPDPVGMLVDAVRGELQAQPRLPAAPRAGERHEPVLVERVRDVEELVLAPDEGGELRGQVVGRRVETA